MNPLKPAESRKKKRPTENGWPWVNGGGDGNRRPTPLIVGMRDGAGRCELLRSLRSGTMGVALRQAVELLPGRRSSLPHPTTTHMVMSPLEFMQRLAALVSRPRLQSHPVSTGCSHPTPRCVPRLFHPQGAKQVTSLLCLAFRARQSTRTRPPLRVRYPVPVLARLSWARLLTKPLGAVWNGERRFAGRKPGRPFVNQASSISNGTLSPLRRPLTIIAAIEHPPVIAKILAHLGLPARAPPRSPARSFDRLPGFARLGLMNRPKNPRSWTDGSRT